MKSYTVTLLSSVEKIHQAQFRLCRPHQNNIFLMPNISQSTCIGQVLTRHMYRAGTHKTHDCTVYQILDILMRNLFLRAVKIILVDSVNLMVRCVECVFHRGIA